MSAEEAQFIQTRQWNRTCDKCGSSDFFTVSIDTPPITRSILEIWAFSNDLNFNEQDEEVILSGKDHYIDLVELLEHPKTTKEKRGIIFQALCITIFDNLADKNDNPDADFELAKEIIVILKKSKRMLRLAETVPIERYIVEKVFPLLEIKNVLF